MSFMSEKEFSAVKNSKLHRTTPFAIYRVTETQFSIARHYGGATFNGSSYIYDPTNDELIRDDVFRFVMNLRKKPRKKKGKKQGGKRLIE